MSKAHNNTYLEPGEPLSEISLRMAAEGKFEGVTVNARTAKKPSERNSWLTNLDKALDDFHARENYNSEPSNHR